MDEQAIRADERALCVAELREIAGEYVELWGPIIGDDAAKADAWNIIVAAERMAKRRADSASADSGSVQHPSDDSTQSGHESA